MRDNPKSTRSIRIATAAAAAIATVCLVPNAASAIDAGWVGADPFSNSFTDPLNWQLFYVPQSGDRAVFSTGLPSSGPEFGAGTVTIDQLLISSRTSDGGGSPTNVWTFFGVSSNENLKVNTDVTLVNIGLGGTLRTSGLDVFTPNTYITNNCGLVITGSSTYTSRLNTSGNGSFSVNNGNTIRGAINHAGTGYGDVFGLLDSDGFGISGGGYIAIKPTGNLIINQNSSVSNGLLYLDSGSQLSMNFGSALQITGSSASLQVTGDYALPNNTKLNVNSGGDVVAASYLDLGNGNTGSMSVDGVGSTVSAQGSTDWGTSATGLATVTLSNSAAASYASLRLGLSSGRADVQLLSSGQLTTTSSLTVGPNTGTTSLAKITVAGGTLNNANTSIFRNGGQLVMSSGGVNFTGDGTFAAGSTFTQSGGFVTIASGKTLNIAGGVVNKTGGNSALNNGATLFITAGGQFNTNSFHDIANGSATGTLIVDGAGSKFNSTSGTTDIGKNAGNFGTLSISNSGVGTYGGLQLSINGGKSVTTLASSGQLIVNSGLLAGGTASAATINIAGGTLNSVLTSGFSNGALVNLSSGGLVLGGTTSFFTGSTLNQTGGALTLPAAASINFNGGFGTITGGQGIPNGTSLRITNGGHLDSGNYLDLARLNATGTLLVDGAGSRITTLGSTSSDWGFSTGNNANVTFSNSGAGTYSNLTMSSNGGTTLVNISTNGVLNTGSLLTGSTGGTANINISGGSLNSMGTALFLNGTAINVSGTGVLQLGGNSTFSAGSTLNWSGGTWNNAAATTLAFDGGAGSFTVAGGGDPGGHRLSNGSTLRITSGGKLTTNSYFDIANSSGGGGVGTMIVDGTGSAFTSTAVGTLTYTDWGYNPTDIATVSFSNFGVGSYNAGLRIGDNGGKAVVNISTNANLNVASILTGNSAATTSASISISGGSLNSAGTALFQNGTAINVTGTGVLRLGGNSTFSTGSTLNALPFAAVSLADNVTLSFDGGVGTIGGLFNGLRSGQALRVTNGGQFTAATLPIALAGPSASLLVDGAGSRYVTTTTSIDSWGQGGIATITFSNGGAGTLGGTTEVGNFGGNATVNVLSGGLLNAGTLDSGFNGTSTFNVNGGTLRTTNNFRFDGGTTLNYAAGTVNVGGTLAVSPSVPNARVLLTSGGNKTLRVGGLDIPAVNNGKVDLSNNSMIVDHTGVSPINTIRGYLQTGRNGGNWLGNGLTSSAAAGSLQTALGYVEASSIGSPATFNGYSIDATTVLVDYTWYGDANLDGKVNTIDFNNLAGNFGGSSKVWFNGDFNYDGNVDSTDFTLLVGSYGRTTAPAAPLPGPDAGPQLGSVVPEPSTLAILGLLPLVRRRNRAAR